MRPASTAHDWAIVLAGGEGQRMGSLIQRWLGHRRPKQYCKLYGKHSMLEHTLARATRLVDSQQIVTVIGNEHQRFLDKKILPGRVLRQPDSLDTGPGIFLPATYVYSEDSEATVVILPSDHFVSPEDQFIDQVNTARELANSFDDKLILIGAVPDGGEDEYGWIEPGCRSDGEASGDWGVLRGVLSFKEKPTPEDAASFLRRGYLWNTMIMVVKVQTLWRLGQQFLPEIMGSFELLLQKLQTTHKGRVNSEDEHLTLSHIYRRLQA
ncbi:MAG: sugar phosphate nucleotidyltransferase, partial [bacterium]